MIISHKYKFIFIKTFKTAGTSIETFLSPLCGSNDIITPIFPPSPGFEPRNFGGMPLGDLKTMTPLEFQLAIKSHEFRNHMGASEIKELVSSEIFENYFKFCVERNPWEKVVSHFYMQKARNNPNANTFEHFVQHGILPIDIHKWFDRTSGMVLVDRVLRYECLTEQLGEVFGRMGIPFVDGLTPKEKSEYRPVKNPLGFYYSSSALVERVAKLFAREIELLGYSYKPD